MYSAILHTLSVILWPLVSGSTTYSEYEFVALGIR